MSASKEEMNVWEDEVLLVVGGIFALIAVLLVIMDITQFTQQGYARAALSGLAALACFVTANALHKLQKKSDSEK